MRLLIDARCRSALPLTRRLIAVAAIAALGLALATGARADAPEGRRAGDPLVEPQGMSATERSTVRGHVTELARSLGIPGAAAPPRRQFGVLDLRLVDETEVVDRRGRTRAVFRTDGATGALRSVVRLDWTPDARLPRVDLAAAPEHARRQARLSGLTPPGERPVVRWDDPMDAWRVTWARRIDGAEVPGDGLTVWIHRGGQLAALSRSETAAAAPPLERVAPEVARAAALGWAEHRGLPMADLTADVAPALIWVRPNDFIARGGAEDTDPLLHLAYRVDLSLPVPGGGTHHLALFVDAGTGVVIAGTETA